MSLPTLVCLVVASMIGSGLYTSSCWSLASLGDASLVLMVWVVGGVIALCGAIAYGALSERLPDSGGEYLYLSTLVHPSVGFLAGWISLIAGFTAPIAAAALVCGTYLSGQEASAGIELKLWAILIIVIGAMVHSLHIRIGIWFQNGVVALKLACLFLILAAAVIVGPSSGWCSGRIDVAMISTEGQTSPIILRMLDSLVWITLSYTGFNASIYVAAEASVARRTVYHSMWIATFVVMVLYVALNFVFLYAADPLKIANNPQFVAVAANAIGGAWLENVTRFAIILSSSTSVLAMLMTGPRVYARMAQDKAMPAWLSSPSQIPRRAIWAQAVLSILVVCSVSLKELIGYLGLTLSLCSALAVSSLWWIRRYLPSALPLSGFEKWCAACYVAASLGILLVAARVKPTEFLACMVTIILGFVLYGVWHGIVRRKD